MSKNYKKKQKSTECKLCSQPIHNQCANISFCSNSPLHSDPKKESFCCSCNPNNSSSHAAKLSSLVLDAAHLNSVFNNVCVDASDEDVENLHFSNVDAQYVDVSSIKSLAFNNTSTPISVRYVNMRSLANLQNFSKLEALICSMGLKPDVPVISITETWTRSLCFWSLQ